MTVEDPFTDIWRSAERMLSRPKFVFTFVISVALIYTHVLDDQNSFFTLILPPTSTNAFIQFLRADLMKITGVLLMIPSALDAPTDRRALVLIASIIFVLSTNTLTYTEYFVMSIFVDIWNHVTLPMTHVIMVLAVIIVAQMNWFSISIMPTSTTPFSSTTAGTTVAG